MLESHFKYTKATCVHYAAEDAVGKILAYSSLLPYVVVLHVASRVYTKRQLHDGVLLLGFVLTEAVARILKHVVKQPRPEAFCSVLGSCSSFGWPSSHTSCMVFALVMYIALSFQHGKHKKMLAKVGHVIEFLAIAVASTAVAASRVYLGYHTTSQVAAGAVLGLILGLVWVFVMHAAVPLYARAEKLSICEIFGFKDTWGFYSGMQQPSKKLA